MPVTAGGRRSALAVAGLAVFVYVVVVGALLNDAGGHPAALVRFGEQSRPLPLAERVLGDDLYVASVQGHDGTNFWVLARDPLLVDPSGADQGVTNPTTRSARILYPLLASPWRLGGEVSLLWGLVLTNLALVAVGTYLAARLSQSYGASARGGFAFALNPAVFFGLTLDLSEVALVTMLVGFVLAVRRERYAWAVALAIAAGLSKEAGLLVVLAVAVLAPRLPRWFRVAAPAAAVGTYGAWVLYVRARAPGDGSSVRAFDPVPFRSLVELLRDNWIPGRDWGAMVLGLLVVAAAAAIVVRFVQHRTLLTIAALPMALATPFYVTAVLYQPEDAGRALGASLTFLFLDLFVGRAGAREDGHAGVVGPAPAAT